VTRSRGYLIPLTGLFAACGMITGCVTEQGRTGPALWSTVSDKADETPTRLKNPVRTNVRYAQFAEKNGKHKQARRHYREALSHNPKSVDAIVGIARLDQYAGRAAEAEQGFQRALRLAPDDPNVLQSVGLFYASQKRWNEAVAKLQAAVNKAPRVAKYRMNLGIVLANAGDFDAAMPHFVDTVGEAKAHYYLGRILMHQGDRPAAAREFQIALSLQPDLEAAQLKLLELQNRGRQRAIAGASPAHHRTGNRHPNDLRSVGHTTRKNDLGSQSAWNGNPADRTNRSEYNDGEPFNRRRLEIAPGSRRPNRDGPVIQPLASPADSAGRPAPSPQQIQQWTNQQPVR